MRGLLCGGRTDAERREVLMEIERGHKRNRSRRPTLGPKSSRFVVVVAFKLEIAKCHAKVPFETLC